MHADADDDSDSDDSCCLSMDDDDVVAVKLHGRVPLLVDNSRYDDDDSWLHFYSLVLVLVFVFVMMLVLRMVHVLAVLP